MEALQLLSEYELVIYVLLVLGSLVFIRQFVTAWNELQGAAFGLEKESAQGKLNQAAGGLVAMLTIAVVVFVLVSFVAPSALDALPTPTLNPFATATATLPPGAPTYTPAPGAEQTQAAAPPPAAGGSGCIPGQVDITTPKPGDQAMGIVPLVGSANIANFGFYRFEIKQPNETIWLTVQAGNTPITNNLLGEWDTSRLAPGEYQLGLVVGDNAGQEMPACIVQLRVAPAPEATPTR